MPITWAKFRFGEDGSPTEVWMRKVQAFLREHPGLAYSEKELRDALLGEATADGEGEDTFENALYWLTALGSVAGGPISGVMHYKYLEEIPELPAVARVS